MEYLALIALCLWCWLIWQLVNAKRFTRFKTLLRTELKDRVIADIIRELDESRSAQLPNTDAHVQATIYYWTHYTVRILQAALQREIISEQWLKATGNWRNSQHLMSIERHYKV